MFMFMFMLMLMLMPMRKEFLDEMLVDESIQIGRLEQ
jgi:hypothetical protein